MLKIFVIIAADFGGVDANALLGIFVFGFVIVIVIILDDSNVDKEEVGLDVVIVVVSVGAVVDVVAANEIHM